MSVDRDDRAYTVDAAVEAMEASRLHAAVHRIGADPRGGRHLDLARQAAAHDPEQLFTTKWGGFRAPQPDYVTDAADWPIMP